MNWNSLRKWKYDTFDTLFESSRRVELYYRLSQTFELWGLETFERPEKGLIQKLRFVIWGLLDEFREFPYAASNKI